MSHSFPPLSRVLHPPRSPPWEEKLDLVSQTAADFSSLAILVLILRRGEIWNDSNFIQKE